MQDDLHCVQGMWSFSEMPPPISPNSLARAAFQQGSLAFSCKCSSRSAGYSTALETRAGLPFLELAFCTRCMRLLQCYTNGQHKLQHSYHCFQVWFAWARSPWLVFPCSINCCFDLQETKGRKFSVWGIHLFSKELLYKTLYAFCVAGVAWGSPVIVDNTLSTIHQHAREKDFPGSAMAFVEQ